jgi:hypothetical protein
LTGFANSTTSQGPLASPGPFALQVGSIAMTVRRLLIAAIGLMFAVGTAVMAETVVEPISLPDRLRSSLDAEQAAIEDPASAEEPCNVRGQPVHPDAILKSLQESIERLSAAGLATEAEEAAQLLKRFEQKHRVRLLIELQDADLTKHRSELDRLQRRLGRIDLDPTRDSRFSSALDLRSAEVELPMVRDERDFDYGRCLIDSRPRPLGSFSYTMSPVWLHQMRKTNTGAEHQRLVLTDREVDLYCRIILAVKARAYDLIFPKPPRKRL